MTDAGKSGALAEKLRVTLDAEQLTNCMRCGFCQTACPTFNETGLEAASPRGRIALMKAVADGFMPADEAFVEQMDLCLGCRACEPACPSDVKYGQLIEQAREAIAAERKQAPHVRLFGKIAMERVIPRHEVMRWVGRALKWYQRSGMRTAVRKTGLLKVLPKHMREMEAVLPEASDRGIIREWQARGLPASWETDARGGRLLVIPAEGEKIARIGLFRGCIMDVLFVSTHVNTVRLLVKAGFEVVIPERQTCCGALHAHAGNTGTARNLALDNVAVFRAANVEWIASNAGGCGAYLQEYDHLLRHTSAAEDGAWLAGRIKDLSELLADYGRPLKFDETKTPVTVTYQDSCHLRNVMRVQRQPRQLIRNAPGVSLRELAGADRCCGSAGIYNLVQPEMSSSILDHKMEHVEATGAQVLVTTNPGCLLQMKWGIHRSGLEGRMEAVHLADLLASRLDAADG